MNNKNGSTLAIVLIVAGATAIAISSVVGLIAVQRRLAVNRELRIQANNVAESALDYAFAYVAADVKRRGWESSALIPTKDFVPIIFEPDAEAFLSGTIKGPTGYAKPTSSVVLSELAVRVLPARDAKTYTVNPEDPASDMKHYVNQVVYERTVPVIARATATQGEFTYTTYIQKMIALRDVPMFQKAIAYEGQLHLHRGYPILGGVHSNSHLVINAHPGDNATYNGMVTAAGHFYRGSAFDEGGTGANPYGYCPVTLPDPDTGIDAFDFAPNYAENIKLVPSNDSTLKIISSLQNETPVTYELLTTTFSSKMTDWKSKALTKFKGNLQDAAHSVPALLPPGVKKYAMDVVTTSKNEFDNGTYGLLEPEMPSSHKAFKPENIYQFARNASLILRVEARTSATGYTTVDAANWIVKAYKRSTEGNLIPLPMPRDLMGQTQIVVGTTPNNQYRMAAPKSIAPVTPENPSGIAQGLFEVYKMKTSATPYVIQNPAVVAGKEAETPACGYFDPRMGRGVAPVTLNIRRMKEVLEATNAGEAEADKRFREILLPDWNGLVYVEFPTSLVRDQLRYKDGTNPAGYSPRAKRADGTPFTFAEGDYTAMDSWPFKYGDVELRHPDRWSDVDNESRAKREDNILPIAPGLRGYPASYGNAEIAKSEWAIPVLQIVNARALPEVPNIKDPFKRSGFTISTNAPLYLVGSFNADGNAATGTNITGTGPTDFAEADSDTDPNMAGTQREISAGLFCEFLTVLSDDWAKGGANAVRFTDSFDGSGNKSETNRAVSTGRVEISACILTGEYPIFEFFIHALESWKTFYGGTYKSPIIIKGAVIGMFHSEVQHIKQAYSRDVKNDIQVYYAGHGSHAIPAVRFHKFLVNGAFPPGTPMARDYGQNLFTFLRPGDPVLADVKF